ncbi:Time for coffee, putative isoform 3 [Hibiscus syriacus]|uniref:Time for coffee, putative isoform 3 n=1 Tax=Hibiscus syriacus TaxID=106335 RepID=A0A6A2XNB3_HIBSY|nr:Time for coffee, putative isoform 3 [Hibiscus syriacus]
MERKKEGRRGLPKRRQRSNNLRDSPDGGEMEIQETVRLRERMSKRERDRDLSNRCKRRRQNKVDGEESTEESSGKEEENETEQLSSRKISPSARISGQSTTHSKATDEMISFPVPRKARSASVKRSHENWVAGNGGLVDEQNYLQSSVSPVRRSVESDRVSPSSSNGSARKKMKTNRPKTRLPKPTKSSTSVQEDIEIEIAEVLFGLMKQSHSSKKEDSAGNPFSKLESDDANVSSTDIKQDQLTGDALKEKKVKVVDSLTPPKVENEQKAEMEICSPEKGQISGPNAVTTGNGTSKTASVVMESRENVSLIKQGDLKPSVGETRPVDRDVTEEKFVTTEKESSNSDVDFQNPTAIKLISKEQRAESQLGEKFKIDLMAPPMASSPVKDRYVDITLDPNYKAWEVEPKVETLAKDEANAVKKEMRADDGKDKKKATMIEKQDSLNLNLEKPDQAVSDCCISEQGQKQQLAKALETAQSSSVHLPNGFPPLGYMPPFPTIAPLDASARSSTTLQPLRFSFSQPRPKRCVMHRYIAHNIHLHQQYAKVNHFWPPQTSFASLSGAKPSYLNVVTSAETSALGNPLVNLSPTEEKSKVAVSFPGVTSKDKTSECAKDTAQRKQVALQKASQPVSAGNLMNGPAFIFPLSQYQTSANQSGPSKPATSTSKASSTDNSTPGISTSSTVLPGVATAVSFNYPNLAANQPPYLTIIQNNGYPFSISAPVGNPPSIRGPTHGQVLPFYNGSFNSSQMFHPQLQQQLARSQPLVQPPYQNAVPSSGSSSSHKQPESQQQRGGQVCASNFLSSTSMHSRQLQEHKMLSSNQSRKMEHEMSGEHTTANAQKKVHCQNPPVHHQPLNFALVPSASVGGGGVDLVPPQAFAMSFTSLTGNNKGSNLNFSSMAQNPAIFHSLPEMARQGYQVAPVPQTAQQKNHQGSDGKSGSSSTNTDDGKKASSRKSHKTNGQTYVFDNSAKSLNFVSSPVTGNWPPRSSTPTTVTINPPIVPNSSSSHQQLLQLQKQHMAQQHHPQPATASRSKTQTTNTMPASSIAAKFSSNAAVFSQTVPQSNPAAQSTPWKNSARTPASPGTRNTYSSGTASDMIVGSHPGVGNLRTSSTSSRVRILLLILQLKEETCSNLDQHAPATFRSSEVSKANCIWYFIKGQGAGRIAKIFEGDIGLHVK